MQKANVYYALETDNILATIFHHVIPKHTVKIHSAQFPRVGMHNSTEIAISYFTDNALSLYAFCFDLE